MGEMRPWRGERRGRAGSPGRDDSDWEKSGGEVVRALAGRGERSRRLAGVGHREPVARLRPASRHLASRVTGETRKISGWRGGAAQACDWVRSTWMNGARRGRRASSRAEGG